MAEISKEESQKDELIGESFTMRIPEAFEVVIYRDKSLFKEVMSFGSIVIKTFMYTLYASFIVVYLTECPLNYYGVASMVSSYVISVNGICSILPNKLAFEKYSNIIETSLMIMCFCVIVMLTPLHILEEFGLSRPLNEYCSRSLFNWWYKMVISRIFYVFLRIIFKILLFAPEIYSILSSYVKRYLRLY